MTPPLEPRHETQDWATREERELIAEAARVAPWTPTERTRAWLKLDARVRGRRGRSWRPALLAPAAVALAAAAYALTPTLGARPEASGPLAPSAERHLAQPTILPGPGADFAVERNGDLQRVTLRTGTLTLTSGGARSWERTVVATPHLAVSAPWGSALEVKVEGEDTWVEVSAGAVRLEHASGAFRVLFAGESARASVLRSEALVRDAAVAAAAEEAPVVIAPTRLSARDAAARTGCVRGDARTRRACLEKRSAGGDLAAQNALFALGLQVREERGPAAALEHWEAYARRFEWGVFAPEVRIALIEARHAAGDASGALDEADRFLVEFGDDPRAEEVRLIREQLRRAREGHGG